MRNVKLNFLLIFSFISGLSYQGYADCPWNVPSNTDLESFFAGWGEWRKEIKVIAMKNQGVNGYFNPRIKVCSYGGEEYPKYCHELYSGTSCKKIYGTQDTGAGISAMVFIDWEGDKTKAGGEFAKGLGWEWAEGVTDEEKVKFANSPKICVCSQKGACRSDFAKWWDKPFSAIDYSNLCDTCYQTKVKCAPVPLAPGPPPFCEQFAMSPPQVRIVPITDKDNDYFDPKVKVIIGDLKGRDGEIGKKLDFPEKHGDKAKEHPITDKYGTTYDFKTYREKDKLCAEYLGIGEKNPQFVRCFPAPPAPEPEVVEIVQSNASGKQSDTLKIRMKMSESTCTYRAHGVYSNGSCTFNVTNHPVNIGPLSLKVVKPKIVERTTSTSDNKSNINDIIENIFKNSSRFTILEQYGYVPNIGIELPNGDSCSLTNPRKHNQCELTKLELDNMGQPKIEVGYMGVKNQVNSNSKMLCLSGWQPEPEEFVLEREGKVVILKSMGTKYIEYNSVYSKESNQFYYLPSKEIGDLLKRPQNQLDKIIFNKQEYVFFPDDNKQEKGKCSYCVKRNDEIDDAFKSSKGLKVVYKLTDVEHKEGCEQGDDGCICFDGKCSRSKQYLNKNEDDKPFYLRYEEVSCKDKNGNVLRDKKNEARKCTQLKDQPIKANRTEVFYADKLCGFDLEGVIEKVLSIIKQRLESKNLPQPYNFSGDNNYTNDLSQYGYIEIEAWGGGEAGHIINEAQSTKSRSGNPGDYIKAQLKIDPNYPVIRAKATEGGGGITSHISNKDGGPTFIQVCDSHMQDCKDLITVAGGGEYRTYGGKNYEKTVVHQENLISVKKIIRVSETQSTEDNKITYIENGEIKYEEVQCNSVSSKYGAGGCINKNNKTYGRGAPGHVKISSVQINYNEIKEIIKAFMEKPDSTATVSDFIKNLYPHIMEDIKKEIRKELLGE